MKVIIIILLNNVCPGFLSVAAINKMSKGILGRKGFILSFRVQSISQGCQGWNSRQELEAETMEEQGFPSCAQANVQLPFLNSLSPLPRDVTKWAGLSYIKSIVHRHACRPIWWRKYFHWNFFLPDGLGRQPPKWAFTVPSQDLNQAVSVQSLHSFSLYLAPVKTMHRLSLAL